MEFLTIYKPRFYYYSKLALNKNLANILYLYI